MAEVSRILAVPALCLLALLTACGQTGPLYLPDQARDVVTRPAATPPPPDESPAPGTVPKPDAESDSDEDPKDPGAEAAR